MAFKSFSLIFPFPFFTDKPVCVEDQNIYGVSEGETAHISCRVDAYPEADSFSWSFNTSSGGMDLSRDSFTNKGSSSLLYYTPKSQMDYGTVLCVAGNVVGRQIVPCIYHVIPAGGYTHVFAEYIQFCQLLPFICKRRLFLILVIENCSKSCNPGCIIVQCFGVGSIQNSNRELETLILLPSNRVRPRIVYEMKEDAIVSVVV